MHILWLFGAGVLVWYLVKHQAERPVWPWVGLGLVALPLLHHGLGMGGMHGMMSRGGHMGMMGGGMMGQGGNMGMIAGLHGLVLLALLVVTVVVVNRVLKARAQANSPMALLQMRLVKGEISPEEYAAIRAKLQG